MAHIYRWTAVMLFVIVGVHATPVAASDVAPAWSPDAPYASPVSPMRAVTLARLPAQPWHPGHRGMDIAADAGQEVRASAPGVVTFTGLVVNRPVVSVRHDDGALSSVEPVETDLEVGARVDTGHVIGTVSAVPGHCAPDTCVHWGLRVAGEYIDPLDVLAGFGPVVLLPRSHGSRRSAIRRRRLCAVVNHVVSSPRRSGSGRRVIP